MAERDSIAYCSVLYEGACVYPTEASETTVQASCYVQFAGGLTYPASLKTVLTAEV